MTCWHNNEFESKKFVDIWPNVSTFLADVGYKNDNGEIEQAGTIGIPPLLKKSDLETLYYLLYGKFRNSQVAYSTTDLFKTQMGATIYVNGMAWSKKVEIQKKLFDLSLDDKDLLSGATIIYNNSSNPSSAPSTGTTDELNYVENQNVTKNKRSKLDAYDYLTNLMNEDVTTWFIDKFKRHFTYIPYIDEGGNFQ